MCPGVRYDPSLKKKGEAGLTPAQATAKEPGRGQGGELGQSALPALTNRAACSSPTGDK